MKEGWTKNTIKGICCKLFAGGDVPKEEFSKAKTEKYYIPIYANGIENNGLYGYTNVAKVNESAITISARGTIGYISIRKEPFYPVVRLITLIPDLNDINLDFLYYSLLFIDFSHSGTSIPQLTVPMIKDIEIAYPSLSEQQRIVSRLDAAFAYIDELKANAEKQLSEARILFQKALTKAMEPKVGWEEKKLGELGELKNGMNFAHNEKGYDMFLLGVGDFGNRFSIDNIEQLSMISLNQKPSNEYLLKNGDIVFVRSNGNKQLVGRSVIVYPNETPITFSGFCIRFRKKTSIVNERFLVSFLKSEGTRRRLFGNGANISNLNQGMLQELIIPIPSLSEQQRIVSRLDAISAHIRELEEVLQKTIVECDALKQALLRKVFE